MILSIRHRILLPFLFITVFMTFSAMIISIELVQNYFDNQLAQYSQKQYIPIETRLQQLVALSDLSQENDSELISLAQITNHLTLHSNYSASIENQILHISELGTKKRFPFPFVHQTFSSIILHCILNRPMNLFEFTNHRSCYRHMVRELEAMIQDPF